jgi:hypothetical protein
VQGVASTVAKTPWKKEPAYPSRALQPTSPVAAAAGSVISKTPKRLRAKTRTTALIATTK